MNILVQDDARDVTYTWQTMIKPYQEPFVDIYIREQMTSVTQDGPLTDDNPSVLYRSRVRALYCWEFEVTYIVRPSRCRQRVKHILNRPMKGTPRNLLQRQWIEVVCNEVEVTARAVSASNAYGAVTTHQICIEAMEW